MPTNKATQREECILREYALQLGTTITYIRPEEMDAFNKCMGKSAKLTVDGLMSNGHAVEITAMPLDYRIWSNLWEGKDGQNWAHPDSDLSKSLKDDYPNKISEKLSGSLLTARLDYLCYTVLIIDADCESRSNFIATEHTFKKHIKEEFNKSTNKCDAVYLMRNNQLMIVI